MAKRTVQVVLFVEVDDEAYDRSRLHPGEPVEQYLQNNVNPQEIYPWGEVTYRDAYPVV